MDSKKARAVVCPVVDPSDSMPIFKNRRVKVVVKLYFLHFFVLNIE